MSKINFGDLFLQGILVDYFFERGVLVPEDSSLEIPLSPAPRSWDYVSAPAPQPKQMHKPDRLREKRTQGRNNMALRFDGS